MQNLPDTSKYSNRNFTHLNKIGALGRIEGEVSWEVPEQAALHICLQHVCHFGHWQRVAAITILCPQLPSSVQAKKYIQHLTLHIGHGSEGLLFVYLDTLACRLPSQCSPA